ncbi:MAG: hypothetical protein BGO13_10410 [Burkholderiales bacterium 66-5]|nr:MAG: hypothetical protein BGO13_10410 [Burkholderiales bacterium 66-5]
MHRCKPTLLAAAAALSMGLYASNASALALGRVTVQSALGEPLRAEIALPQVSAVEADSLNVTIASPDVFRAQGLEYSAAVKGIRLDLRREANGKMVLRLSSNQTITDPFIDLVVDAAWNAGHIVRSYTMLFDPPGLRSAPAPIAPLAPQADTPTRSSASAAPVRTPQVAAAPAPASASAPALARKIEASPGEVKVRSGDTAGAIASAHRPSGISLDQMLVALVRANPQAFIDGNVNRLRAGSVLQIPDQASAEATPAAEARKIVAAQSRDFNAFRHRLAGAAPAAGVEAASRASSGKVQTQVAESRPEAASADKLTLSKGGAAGEKADAETAQTKQADQASARMAELSKNISELKALSDGATDAKAAPAAQPAPGEAAKPGVEMAAPAAPATDATPAPRTQESATPAAPPAAEPPAPAAAPEPEPAAAAKAPAEEPPKPAPAVSAPAPEPQEEPGLLASLTESPMAAGGALALVLLLLGWGGYRWQQGRRKTESPETTFASEADHPDSFFAESGGQEVDTTSSDLTTGSTSTLYSPSQLDQTGDVDPIAEADVYLAYGKDPQAEEILKEAFVHHPEKVAIPAKLAEIYAKRQDRAALEGAARQVHALAHGEGPDWERVRELGHSIDPENPFYQTSAPQPDALAFIPPAAEPAADAAALPEIPAVPMAEAAQTGAADSVLPSIDLDLDLAPSAHTASADTAHAASASAFTAAAVSAAQQALEVPAEPDSGIGGLTLPAALTETMPSAAHLPETMGEPLEFPTEGLALADSGPMPLSPKEMAPTEPAPLEFDFGGLSLDLDRPSAAAPHTPAAVDLPSLPELPSEAAADAPLPDDPLSTKLALAEEFKTIGDSEGARALIEEVLAEASGEVKAQAERLLGTLG